MKTTITTPNKKSFQLRYNFYEHQKETVRFMLKNKWAYIFNEAGTCKTECIISSIAYHLLNNDVKKVLIISTLSTLKNVWYSSIEANNLLDTINPIVVTGTKIKKEKILIEDKNTTYIINPDAIKNLESFLILINFDYIVIDEATTFKIHTSDRYKSLLRMIKKTPPKYFYLATGTPVPNKPSDAFGLLKLFRPKLYSNFTDWRTTVEREIRDFTWIPLKNYKETLFNQLQPSICYKKEDVLLDLKHTEFFFEKFNLSKEQEKHYKEMKKDFITLLEKGEKITSPNSAVKLSKMLQILGGSILDENKNITLFDVDDKIKVLKNIIKTKVKNKLIIFCSHKAQLQILQNNLKEYDTRIISGDTSERERDNTFYDFQNKDKIDIIIAMPQCMAHGITLTRADAIIYFNPIFSNEIYQQANARIARPSQLEIPKIFHLWSNATDYSIYMKLQDRMSEQDCLLSLLTEE